MASTSTQWILELDDKITASLRQIIESADAATSVINDANEAVDGLGKTSDITSGKLGKLVKGMSFFKQLKEGIGNITSALDDAIAPGVKFETAVAAMGSATGLSGKELDTLAEKARATAKAFGMNAADATVLYSDLLTKLSPTLKDAPDALQQMSTNVMNLSKIMHTDAAGATEVMTTAMKQFGISMDNPLEAARTMTEYVNVMAAGSAEGATSVAQIAEALEQVGQSAHTSGISFAEVNSAIQMLDKAGKRGAEGGTALNGIMNALESQTPGTVRQLQSAGISIQTLRDHSLSLSDRLSSLTPVMRDASVMTALFGAENADSALSLVAGAGQMDEWTAAIQGTTAATELAAVQMDTYAEKQKRMQSFIDDLKISFFEFVEPIAPVIEIIGGVIGTLVTLGTVAWSIGQIMSIVSLKAAMAWMAGMSQMVIATVTSSTLMSTAIYSIPIIGWIALVVAAITAVVAILWNKFAEVRAFFYGLWNFIVTVFTEYYSFIFNVMKAICEVINPANWFDNDFHFADVWDTLSNQALEGGKKVGSAFSDGWKEGMADWDKSQSTKKKNQAEDTQFKLGDTPLTPANRQTAKPDGGGGSSPYAGRPATMGGSGGGNTRTVNMNVTMNNNFSVVANNDVRHIVNQVKRELIAVMTDVVPTIA